jgi:hypothetical protein
LLSFVLTLPCWRLNPGCFTHTRQVFYHWVTSSIDIILSLLLCCTGDTLWHLPKFLQYNTVEFTLSIILLYPLLTLSLE